MDKPKKTMSVVVAQTIRSLVATVNEMEIQKEDIISLQREGSQYILIYYK